MKRYVSIIIIGIALITIGIGITLGNKEEVMTKKLYIEKGDIKRCITIKEGKSINLDEFNNMKFIISDIDSGSIKIESENALTEIKEGKVNTSEYINTFAIKEGEMKEYSTNILGTLVKFKMYIK